MNSLLPPFAFSRKCLLLILYPFLIFQASLGLAGVKDYVALVDGDPNNLLVRWGMMPANPYDNSATGPLANAYPGLQKWMSRSPEPEFRDDGFSAGSGVVLTGCASPEDRVAAALQTMGEIKYFPETTIEILFSPQRLPDGSDEAESGSYLTSPGRRVDDEETRKAGRLVLLLFKTGAWGSSIGPGAPKQAAISWEAYPEAGHWYYAVIQLKFTGENFTEMSAHIADLTSGEKEMRTVVGRAGKKQNGALFTEKGVPLRIGAGQPKGEQNLKSAPTLFDEIVISKGLLTTEQMNERLAALLKP